MSKNILKTQRDEGETSTGKLYLFAGLGCVIGVLYFVYQEIVILI